ncbi:MAG: 50S ribosomal protein L25 [Candidatus Dormiibacterota bacterium]
MADLTLAARARSERGRHAGALRRAGQVPAVLYGQSLEPQAIVTEAGALIRVWQRAGRTHLVDLSVEGKAARKVLIREFQIDPRSARPLHVDFQAVNLRERMIVEVPVVTVGDPPAVSQLKIGILQQVIAALRVEALPAGLPSHLQVDVSGLSEIDQAVRVRDVVLPPGVTLPGHVDPEEVVAKIAALRVAVEEEVAAPEAAPPAPEAEEPTTEE